MAHEECATADTDGVRPVALGYGSEVIRILLVSPADRLSMIGFSGIADDADASPIMPNLALLTLAALVPNDVEVEVTIVDEQVEPIDFDGQWDFVASPAM